MTEFSDFIRNAPEEEKAEVFERVMEKATNQQSIVRGQDMSDQDKVEALHTKDVRLQALEDRFQKAIESARKQGITYAALVGILDGLKHELLVEWRQ